VKSGEFAILLLHRYQLFEITGIITSSVANSIQMSFFLARETTSIVKLTYMLRSFHDHRY